MKKYVSLLICFLLSLGALAQKSNKSVAQLQRPKLLVGIVVDQMRWDYLYRFYNRFGEGGFKRLLNEGFSAEYTHINYAATVTAPGHASIYTGTVPAVHGITENDIILQSKLQHTYCVADSSVKSLGGSAKAGKMSPRNLLASTIGDELKMATNFRSKVIGIALKDRGAILPAGHAADASYWFDDKTGNWISSTYYMKDLPDWLKKFNEQKLPEKYLKQDWNTLYPIETYTISLQDDNPFERKIDGTVAPTLPVKTSELISNDWNLIRNTPFGNSMTVDLALAVLKNEDLGKDDITDLLAVSFSSTDYIGHDFGPKSIEVEDTFLRLDRDLASLFGSLDVQVGKGNYTVFLSADHGGAENAIYLKDHHIPGGLWPEKEIGKKLNMYLEQQFGQKGLLFNFDNYQVTLNHALIKTSGLDEAAIRKACISFLEKQEGVAYVLDMLNSASASIPQIIKTGLINSYHPDRSGSIFIALHPGWYHGTDKTGTTHGTWNPYDSHIPLLFMGWGIKAGKTSRTTNISDIAPTLSTLLRIQTPSGSIGQPISEALK
ncbi:MAG: hypothetical protein RI924_220 [Bacteroidota bacterium]|jgi:predicted AlkP superfamily pyrophosphatase or phosphodiesterase